MVQRALPLKRRPLKAPTPFIAGKGRAALHLVLILTGSRTTVTPISRPFVKWTQRFVLAAYAAKMQPIIFSRRRT